MAGLKTVAFLITIQLLFLILPFVCELNLFLSYIGYGHAPISNVKLENPRMWQQMSTHDILNCMIMLVLMFHLLFELFTMFSLHFILIVISEMLVFSIYMAAFHDPSTTPLWTVVGIVVSGVLKFAYAIIVQLNEDFAREFMYDTYYTYI